MKVFEPMMRSVVSRAQASGGAYETEGVDLDLGFKEAIAVHMVDFYCRPGAITLAAPMTSQEYTLGLIAEPDWVWGASEDMAGDPDLVAMWAFVIAQELATNGGYNVAIPSTKRIYLPEPFVYTRRMTAGFFLPVTAMKAVLSIYYKRVELTEGEVIGYVARRQ